MNNLHNFPLSTTHKDQVNFAFNGAIDKQLATKKKLN